MENSRIKKTADKFINAYNARFGTDHTSIIYRGNLLSLSNGIQAYGRKPGILNRELAAEFEAIIKRRDRLSASQKYAHSALSVLFGSGCSNQDIRDGLSDTIALNLEPYCRLDRTREEAFMIRGSPIKMQQWEQAKEYIEYYLVNNMVM